MTALSSNAPSLDGGNRREEIADALDAPSGQDASCRRFLREFSARHVMERARYGCTPTVPSDEFKTPVRAIFFRHGQMTNHTALPFVFTRAVGLFFRTIDVRLASHGPMAVAIVPPLTVLFAAFAADRSLPRKAPA